MNSTKKFPYTMNNKLIPFKSILLLLLLISSCNVPPTVQKAVRPTVNVMILLDLSDRLIEQDGQSSRDKELVNHICSEMANIIRDNNGVDRSKETIKIQIAYQDSIPYSTRQFSDSLYFKMSKEVRGGIPAVRKILLERFSRNLDQLYKAAVFSKIPTDYSGANISRYFIQDLNNDIKRDSMTTNLLFILTDGYVVVGQDNNLMLDVHNTFPELKVMVLEIAPRNENYESERIQQSWDNWFAKMAVKGYALRNIGPTEAVKSDITRFLKGTLELTVPGKFTASAPPPPPPLPPSRISSPTQPATITNPAQPQRTTSESGTNRNTTPIKNTSKTGSSEKPQPPPLPPPQKIRTTLHLANGDVYVGETLNGQPDGIGSLTYSESRQICENDTYKRRADAGDILDGTWREGKVAGGKLKNSGGVYRFTIICEGV
jgi:hypothetical protein